MNFGSGLINIISLLIGFLISTALTSPLTNFLYETYLETNPSWWGFLTVWLLIFLVSMRGIAQLMNSLTQEIK